MVLFHRSGAAIAGAQSIHANVYATQVCQLGSTIYPYNLRTQQLTFSP
jgi:hypothetical protein